MKVLIGVDPHKGSVAVAAVDEAKGELLERASFPQNRAGLRALERWAKRFPERRWAVENACGLGRHLAVRLAAAGESVVDVPPKLSARVRVLSSGNARKNDVLDALATALAASRNERLAQVDHEAASEAPCKIRSEHPPPKLVTDNLDNFSNRADSHRLSTPSSPQEKATLTLSLAPTLPCSKVIAVTKVIGYRRGHP
jgi:hypothetical protein